MHVVLRGITIWTLHVSTRVLPFCDFPFAVASPASGPPIPPPPPPAPENSRNPADVGRIIRIHFNYSDDERTHLGCVIPRNAAGKVNTLVRTRRFLPNGITTFAFLFRVNERCWCTAFKETLLENTIRTGRAGGGGLGDVREKRNTRF